MEKSTFIRVFILAPIPEEVGRESLIYFGYWSPKSVSLRMVKRFGTRRVFKQTSLIIGRCGIKVSSLIDLNLNFRIILPSSYFINRSTSLFSNCVGGRVFGF